MLELNPGFKITIQTLLTPANEKMCIHYNFRNNEKYFHIERAA